MRDGYLRAAANQVFRGLQQIRAPRSHVLQQVRECAVKRRLQHATKRLVLVEFPHGYGGGNLPVVVLCLQQLPQNRASELAEFLEQEVSDRSEEAGQRRFRFEVSDEDEGPCKVAGHVVSEGRAEELADALGVAVIRASVYVLQNLRSARQNGVR